MRRLEITEKYRADTEEEAKNFLDDMRESAATNNYTLKKSGYEFKTKKAKGEIIDVAYICTVTKEYGSVWDND